MTNAPAHGHEEGHCSSLSRDTPVDVVAAAAAAADGARHPKHPTASFAASLAAPPHAIATAYVAIPGGEFTMGTSEPVNAEDGESPPRRVRVAPFYLAETETSVGEFAAFVRATGHVTDAETFGWSFAFERTLSPAVNAQIKTAVQEVPWWVPVPGADWAHPNGPDSVAEPDMPVTHVSHHDAKAYCAWANARLPREAEFEFAMRGGLEQNLYPWGNDLVPNGTHRANLWQGDFPAVNTAEDGYMWACPVRGMGPQNAYGLYNIVGNVWEWVADGWTTQHHKYIPRPPAVLENPQVELHAPGTTDERATERVKRGGSYMCHESYCLRYFTASRSHNTADSSAQNLGFRCARDVPDPDATTSDDDDAR